MIIQLLVWHKNMLHLYAFFSRDVILTDSTIIQAHTFSRYPLNVCVPFSLPVCRISTYSSINCLSEFYTKFIYNECNWTYITLPSIYTNAIICGEVHAKCIEHVEDVWGEYVESLRDICLDSCWSLSHRSTITNAPIRNNSLIKRLSGLANKDLAFLSVSYPLRSVRVYRKAMINNFTEFLCEC